MEQPIPKVRGQLRSQSRIKAKVAPNGYRTLESAVDREANEVITATISAQSGECVVSVTMDHTGGTVLLIQRRGKRLLLVSVGELDEAELTPVKIAADNAALRITHD